MVEDYSNGMVKYTSRDYESLQKDFWDIVPKMTELWRPEADSDPGVVLGKYLANVANMLGINLDMVANEVYAPTVSQRKNAEKLFNLRGYSLGWYTAARTEVTFTNNGIEPITLDFTFNGSNFATLTAETDITNQARTIVYNILPGTSGFGDTETRSMKQMVTDNVNLFTTIDKVTLQSGESVTRVAIEGELRQASISVADIKRNNYIFRLPSQHVDTTAVWIKTKRTDTGDYLDTQWIQVASPADFVVPEPRFAVTYDSYSNAQVQLSNYLNQLENYSSNTISIYWMDCSGVIGCVNTNVLGNFLSSNPDESLNAAETNGDLGISNLSNIVELPHTYAICGKSPETAKQAYYNSRNYCNTWDSLITLPDFTRFLRREPGVDTGTVLDCQKALDINLAIYNDTTLTESQKSKMYITNDDFPSGDPTVDWSSRIKTNSTNVSAAKVATFATNFKTNYAMCFAIHNDFNDSIWGNGEISNAQFKAKSVFKQYKPPKHFIENVILDYKPIRAINVDVTFGWLRIFEFGITGLVYPKRSVDASTADNIISAINEALSVYFAPANRAIGAKPTVMEVVDVIRNADSRIDYFDAGSLANPVINWHDCDIEFFNPISFCRYMPNFNNIAIAPEYLLN